MYVYVVDYNYEYRCVFWERLIESRKAFVPDYLDYEYILYHYKMYSTSKGRKKVMRS
jgi:hypothetical protein